MKEGNNLVNGEPFTGQRYLVKVYEKLANLCIALDSIQGYTKIRIGFSQLQ